jgi:hypothetical protein
LKKGAFVPGSMNNFGATIRTSSRTIFKIWHRKPMDSENKIAVIIRITASVENPVVSMSKRQGSFDTPKA